MVAGAAVVDGPAVVVVVVSGQCGAVRCGCGVRIDYARAVSGLCMTKAMYAWVRVRVRPGHLQTVSHLHHVS